MKASDWRELPRCRAHTDRQSGLGGRKKKSSGGNGQDSVSARNKPSFRVTGRGTGADYGTSNNELALFGVADLCNNLQTWRLANAINRM